MEKLTPFKRWMIVIAVMTSAIMVLIDMTIAMVAMPQMQGALGATSDSITWVLTAYTMAEAIFIPMTSFFAAKLGERRLLLFAVSGFMLASMLCGQAQSIETMVFFRVIQGAFGAAVIPLSQSILISIFPDNQRNKAMAIFSIGILVGPILGPSLGGLITENMNWRWVFYVNLPVGLFCLAMIYAFVDMANKRKADIHWGVIASMALGVGLLQMVLDQGNQKDWFESGFIQISLVIALLSLVAFVYQSFKSRSPAAPIWLIRNRNLALSSIMMAIFVSAVFGLTSQVPMMLEGMLNYPVDTTGFLLAPRGVAAGITLILTARLMTNERLKWAVFVGVSLCALSGLMMTQYSLNIDPKWVVLPTLLQGCGMGLVFSSLSNMAYTTLAKEHQVGGASIYNLFRTVGSSFGISIVTTFQFRQAQTQWNSLGEGINPYSVNLQNWLDSNQLQLTDPSTITLLQQQLHQQSEIVAFVHTYAFVTLLFLSILPFLFFIKIPKSQLND
ncbi:DHA2 family efflux MFS transporter permease subunit [Paraferrimonas haliotis]|uniref:MFS transporter n=1 Tax=Paraferrimonas haliotis TaxID=2013866 RepID=A0AA37WVX1_9GAMM|nr:DHA2 family efflux MFS transporter permease subunit [Paraferrimonas haliotis]GLS82893.1 MFS transporter [Paraferrimonas haliotis]